MFESTTEEVSAFDREIPHPTFLQRSISAPAIAEHVSEAILPAKKFEEDSFSMLYQHGNNPSRLNPRMPVPKRGQGDHHDFSSMYDDSNKSNLSLLDETISGSSAITNAMLSPLYGDSIMRTPMDLIQADFPSTPSSVFQNRFYDEGQEKLELMKKDEKSPRSSPRPDIAGNLLSGMKLVTDSNSSGHLPALVPSSAVHNNDDASIEEVTKTYQQLYIKGGPTQQTSNGVIRTTTPFLNSAGNSKPMESMLTLSIPTGNNGNNSQPSTGSSNSSPALQMLRQPQNESKMLFDNVVNPRNNSQIPSTGKSVSLGHLPSGHNGMAHNYGSLINNNIPNNSLNPLGMNNNGSNIMGGMMPQGQGQQIPQPAYYVQQPVYLDQNGQPMYYRSGPEFLYPGMDASNNQLGNLMGNGDPNISGMQNNFGGYNNMQGHMPNSVMWQGNMQNGDPSVYMNAQHGMQAPRIMFNPVTGLYTTIPASSSMPGLMPGNQQNTMIQGRGGNNMNSPSMYGQNVPGNNMMQGLMTNNNSMGIPALLPRAQMGILGPDGTDNQSAYFNRDDHHSADYQRKDHRNNRDDMDYSGRGNDRRDRDQYGKNDRDRGDRRERGDRGDRDRRNGTATNGVNPVRDSLVEDFRNTYGKSRQWSLRDLTGHVVAFCQDQHGSRFIQQRLEECADSDKQIVFDEIIPAAQQLMTDVFGNYVLQKLFEYGNADQCESLAELLKGQAVILAMQMYGCRVVQKALEYVNTDRLIELVSEFDDPSLLLKCVHDSNGNHVIQKCIEIVSKVAKEAKSPESSDFLSSKIQFIINAFQGKVKELSSHPYGCRVVQRILEHCSNKQKAVVLEELRQCCAELVQDCYGNYVIQFVMQHGWDADRAVLIREVQAHLLDFSQHKFASNVVEKCLQYANKKDRDEMIWTIINVTFDLKNPVDAKGHCVLESMVRDPYANYVVQKVIDVSDERQRGAIMRYVKENITQLRRYTYGKHIIVRLEKITNEKF